jgi:uncharacterized protein DUF5908
MPVEIKELQIVTIVTDNKGPANTSNPDSDPDKIIAACVEQVLEILKQKNER